MKSWKHKNIEWFYDEDGDRSSWKSSEQLDRGFRLPTVKEVLTLIDYDNNPLSVKDAPFSGDIWTKNFAHDTKNIVFCVDLETGRVYLSSKNNQKTLLLVKE